MSKYEFPEKMIQNSRFRTFYAAWSTEEKHQLTGKMRQLLRENAEYADRKNYGHLCNLITSLAMVMVLEENGKERREAEKIVARAMYRFLTPQIRSMKKLAGHKWFVRFLKITMPVKFKATLGYGWKVEFPKCTGDTFSMTTHRCIYHQLFSKYGMPEMTAVFCKVDDILYSDLPCAKFTYTERIGTGGKVCDYSFIKRDSSSS